MHDYLSDQTGCLVYQVLQTIRPRSRPSENAEYTCAHQFKPGQMIAVDMIRQGDDTTYLRLSDGSGWLPTTAILPTIGSTPLVTVQEVKVEQGVWPFYVDNCPVGQAIRRHPIDSIDNFVLADDGNNKRIVIESMQRIYCDRKVIHPQTHVCFYRVQGTTGWVFNKRSDQTMLIDVSRVKTGIFCFQALVDMVARRNCSTETDYATPFRVKKGQTVAVDIIRSSDKAGVGPFLRLTDGSGWLYTHADGVEMMKEVPVTCGLWELNVLNPPVGVTLRRHPLNCHEKIYNKIYPSGSLIQADCLVKMNHSEDKDGKDITYYRVRGTTGWVIDRRGETQMLELLTDHDNASINSNVLDSTSGLNSEWTPEFVRGVASTIEHVSETDYCPNNQVLTFETDDDLRIVVYCMTRTVGVRPNHQSYTWSRNCTPKQLWEHLRKDLVELVTSDSNTVCVDNTGHSLALADFNTPRIEKEEELRNDLLELEGEIQALQNKRTALLEDIRAFDRERAGAARKMKQQLLDRDEENGFTAEVGGVTIIQEATDQIHENPRGHFSNLQPESSNEIADIQAITSTDTDNSSKASSVDTDTTFDVELDNSDPMIKSSKLRRKAVHSRIQHLLELRSQGTITEFFGSYADSFTMEDQDGDSAEFGSFEQREFEFDLY